MKRILNLAALALGLTAFSNGLNATILMSYVEDASGVTGTVTLDPADWNLSGLSYSGVPGASLVTGPDYASFGGVPGSNVRMRIDNAVSFSPFPFLSGGYNAGSSPTGGFFSMYEPSGIEMDDTVINLLNANQTSVSTVFFAGKTLTQLGLVAGTGTVTSQYFVGTGGWQVTVSDASTSVPDGGATLALLGLGLVGMGVVGRRAGRR